MRSIVLCALGIVSCVPAWPLDRDLTLTQFNHRTWDLRALAPTAVESFAQMSDGTFWLGGRDGLSSFDGLRFDPLRSVDGQNLPSTKIAVLLAASEGGLWVGYRSGGASLIHDGHLANFAANEGLPDGAVHSLAQDHDRAIWAATDGGLARFDGTRWQRVPLRSDAPVFRVFVSREATVWAVTADAVFARAHGQSDFALAFDREFPGSARGMAQAPDGTLYLSEQGHGVLLFDPLRPGVKPRRLFANRRIDSLLIDRDGTLWMTGDRLLRAVLPAEGGVPDDLPLQEFGQAQGLSGHLAGGLFEDREGIVWAGTTSGIDALNRGNVVKLPLTALENTEKTLVAGDAGQIWVSNSNGLLLLIDKDGQRSQMKAPPFTAGVRTAQGAIWFGGASGIAELVDGKLHHTPLPDAAAGRDVTAMTADRNGRLWVSVDGKGMFRFDDGRWLEGLPQNLPGESALAALTDDRGDLWFGYRNDRLARLRGDRVQLFTAADGLATGTVSALHAKDSTLWIAGEKSLMHFDGTRFRRLVPISCQPFVGVAGLAAVGDDLWVFRSTGISRIDAWSQHIGGSGDARVTCKTYSAFDGLNGSPQDQRPALIRGTDNRLWVATGNGVSWIDPLKIQSNLLAPLLTIKAVYFDDTYHRPVQGMQMPPGTKNVQIGYAAWSMTIPERLLFRYRLEGLTRDWRGATRGERLVDYTNLGPGRYRFQLQAANEDHEWNDTGAALDFIILPKFYQTWWFYGLCALAFIGLLSVLIRMQVRRANARLRARLEERMLERERIARELHDTLLQGLQGLILRFQSVAARIPAQEPTRAMLERVLERADEVMIESRDRVKDLRSFNGGSGDLAQDIASTGRDLLGDARTRMRVVVHGAARDLHPIVREEAFLIAREALGNAARHARANEIEVDVFHDRAALRVVIRDDGCGIDPIILRAGGREGHWGLLGMRERSKKIRAHLDIWSRVGAGTEVELRVPATLAYRAPVRRRRWFSIPDQRPAVDRRGLESTKES